MKARRRPQERSAHAAKGCLWCSAGNVGLLHRCCPSCNERDSISEFTITSQINAPVEAVWEVLHDFGDIQRWNPGVAASKLTSAGPVAEGATRRCDFAPFGGAHERIDRHIPNERMTVHLYETWKLPISGAVADFNIAPLDGGTVLTLHYSYKPNLLGRLKARFTDRLLRRGIGGLSKGLPLESERFDATRL